MERGTWWRNWWRLPLSISPTLWRARVRKHSLHFYCFWWLCPHESCFWSQIFFSEDNLYSSNILWKSCLTFESSGSELASLLLHIEAVRQMPATASCTLLWKLNSILLWSCLVLWLAATAHTRFSCHIQLDLQLQVLIYSAQSFAFTFYFVVLTELVSYSAKAITFATFCKSF